MTRVVVLGDVMLDVVARPLTAIQPTSDTAADVAIGGGGSAANLAVALVTGGCAVRYVGAVGDDPLGELARADLAARGVGVDLAVHAGPTGVVVAVVGPDGQRAMLTRRGANSALSARDVLDRLRGPFDHLHVSGYTILDGATRAVARAAIDAARARGAGVSVAACSVAPLRELGAARFLEAAAGATMIFANEEEAVTLADAGDAPAAAAALAATGPEVLVTRGARGAVVVSSDGEVRVPSRATRVVDTTGAGDAATGAYLAARLSGASVADALERAMDAAARAVEGLGARAQSRW